MISAATGEGQPVLAAQFVSGPQLFDTAEAERRFADWLTDIAPDQASALRAIVDQYPHARAILLGIAEASPYLFDLLRADAARALRVLNGDPVTALPALIARATELVGEASSEADVMTALRRMKSEAALMIALCDIGGVWPVMQVTRALTDLAITSVQAAIRYLLTQEAGRGRILPPDPAKPEEGSGLIVFAMGKMGAGELNYSSDIDLIVYFDLEEHTLAEDIEPNTFFVRVAQGMSRLLQQRTGDGYVFRVDLRLRPDPASTPVAVSTASALYYYEREGRTW
ncbi:MAG: bifunctional [glutamine synthetase] adenylyltransferase/[glutamine synthetase]-adenylyl-L-tyrosine phosphorylase, partial [Pseudorhodoplanes sp.]